MNENMMIDPAALAFDIDDVFADTMSLFLEIARNDYNLDDIRPEDITSYMIEECIDIDFMILEEIFGKILDGSHTSRLRPLTGAAEVVRRLAQRSRPVLFVTARPSPGSITGWLQDVLCVAPEAVDVVATGSFDGKVDVLKERKVSFFVEDRLETCFSLSDSGITPILFKRPWNRQKHPFVEIGSWKELEALIAFSPAGSHIMP